MATIDRIRRGLAAAAVASVALMAAPASPAAGATGNVDALQARVRAELALFTGWLQANGVQGYIGEVGWPNTADTAAWNALATKWYADAAAAGVWTTAWSAGEWWGCGYKLSVYTWSTCSSMDGTLDTARSQAPVIQAQASADRRGVNMSGGEFGTPGPLEETSSFSNTNPGAYDTAYHYDTRPSYDYLASKGISLVRLQVRWERVQPVLGGALDAAEVQRIRDAVAAASAAGLRVILDVHNYGAYWLSDGSRGVRRSIGSAEVTVDHFATLWRHLSTSFRATTGVVGYDLMNEPVGMSGPAAWEQASQAAVTAIRQNGDNKLVLVPGYNWSGAQQWTSQHPQAWIDDPADNIRYTAHHYWDRDSSGAYLNTYAAEVTNAQSRGYTASPTKAGPPADFDGDGRSDISVFRPAPGQWLVRGQAGSFLGAGGDIPVPCDFDGDGTTDEGVFRPAVGGWYVHGQAPVFHGRSGDVPVPADYDGDGDCDIAVFRPSVGGWYIQGRATVFYGLVGDIPVPGDYDGNGTADVAVYRPAVGGWYRNGAAPTFYGLLGDVPVPGDYDGNGTTDLAVYRPAVGGWYRMGQATRFLGLATDIPQPGDYDGDGTTDLAVYRPLTGAWIVGAAAPVYFGGLGDQPLPLPAAIRMALYL
jgi:hypothetical protein